MNEVKAWLETELEREEYKRENVACHYETRPFVAGRVEQIKETLAKIAEIERQP